MYYIYKLHSKENELLYIGKTNSLSNRLKDHKKKKVWFNEVYKIVYAQNEDKYIIDSYEIDAIECYEPKYNKAYYCNVKAKTDEEIKLKYNLTFNELEFTPIDSHLDYALNKISVNLEKQLRNFNEFIKICELLEKHKQTEVSKFSHLENSLNTYKSLLNSRLPSLLQITSHCRLCGEDFIV